MFDDDPRDIEPTYSPLLGAEVPAALLHVYFCENHKWNPAFDEHDEVIEALVTDTERDLCDRITRPGRHRVVARDPHKQFILRRRDIILRPCRRPGVTPQPAPAPYSDAIIDLYKHQVKVADEARAKAEDDLREERRRNDALRNEQQACSSRGLPLDIDRRSGAVGQAGSGWYQTARLRIFIAAEAARSLGPLRRRSKTP